MKDIANAIGNAGFSIFLGLLLLSVSTCSAHSAEATLPMSARIINLTDMPLEEAIAFCNERNLVCPAIRSKADPITEVQFSSAGSE